MQVSDNLFSSACSLPSGCGAVVVMNKLKSLRSSDEEFSSLRITFVLAWFESSCHTCWPRVSNSRMLVYYFGTQSNFSF